MTNITREELSKTANEFSELFGLDPPIDLNRPEQVVIDDLYAAIGMVVPEDAFSSETVSVLKKLAPFKQWKTRN